MELVYLNEKGVSPAMMSYSGIERRRSQRVGYSCEVWYKDRNKSTQGFKHAYGKNISEHGLLFETFESFPPCTILELKLVVTLSNGQQDTFNALIEIVRVYEIKKQWLYNIGSSFCKIDNEYRKLIREYALEKLSEPSKDVPQELSFENIVEPA